MDLFVKLKPGVPQVYDMTTQIMVAPNEVVRLKQPVKAPQLLGWLKHKVLIPVSEEEYLEYLKKYKPKEYEELDVEESEESSLTPFTREELEDLSKTDLFEEYQVYLEDASDPDIETKLAAFNKLKKADMVNTLLGKTE